MQSGTPLLMSFLLCWDNHCVHLHLVFVPLLKSFITSAMEGMFSVSFVCLFVTYEQAIIANPTHKTYPNIYSGCACRFDIIKDWTVGLGRRLRSPNALLISYVKPLQTSLINQLLCCTRLTSLNTLLLRDRSGLLADNKISKLQGKLLHHFTFKEITQIHNTKSNNGHK